jgi:FkbM family methyltransferase
MFMKLGESSLVAMARSVIPIVERLRSITFSQYSEDILLYHLLPQKAGFYVDVGAHHPWRDSNTYKLYLRGWSGITIEPNPDVALLFKRMRPRDTHLSMGISPQTSELEYYKFVESKLNSFDPEQGRRMNVRPVETIRVACQPLRKILAAHAGGRTIDLLSIDCEGFDFGVLESLDWDKTRPCAIVIEDFEQFASNNDGTGPSRIHRFLAERDYVLVTQAAFSFIYIDSTAFSVVRDEGFCLRRSQYGSLRRDPLRNKMTVGRGHRT